MPHATRSLLLMPLLGTLLAGCQGYSFTFNEREVFTPPPLFAGYRIDDPALQACVRQAIEDGGVTSADKLQDLNCSNAGIHSLAGIEVFMELRRLGLDGNALESLAPLEALPHLELIQARGNHLRSLGTGLCKGTGRRIALSGNNGLACADLEQLRACGVAIVDAPAPCAAPGSG